MPPEHTFRYLPGYPDLLSTKAPNISRYYGFGIIAVGGTITHFLSAPNHPFGDPDPRFLGAKLIWSPDAGRTWWNQDGSPVVWEPWEERGRDNMVFFAEPGDAFSLLTVLQMGRGYAENKDGYVYAPNGNAEGTDEGPGDVPCRGGPRRRSVRVRILRCAQRRRIGGLERRRRYRRPGSYVPTRLGEHHDPPVRVAPQRRLQRAARYPHDSQLGHGLRRRWDVVREAELLWPVDGARPWGPWEQVDEDTAWTPGGDTNTRAYQPQILPAWIAEDGKSF